MARIAFSALIYEIVGKLGGSVFQYSYGGWQVHVRNSPRNPQTKYQQLRRGDFGFLAASWRNLTTVERQTFIDAAVTAPAAFNLFVATNVNLILINKPTVTSYIPTTTPISMPIIVDALEPGQFDIIASTATNVVPAGSSLLVYATNLKAPTKIFTNPSQYSPISVFPAGTSLAAATSILPEYIARFGQINADLRLCIKSVLIDTTNGSRGAESINCTISEDMAKFVKIFVDVSLPQTAGTAATDVCVFSIPANTLVNNGDVLTMEYAGQSAGGSVNYSVNPSVNGTGIAFAAFNGNDYIHISCRLQRQSPTSFEKIVTLTTGLSTITQVQSSDGAVDFTAPIDCRLTIHAPVAGAIVIRQCDINKELL